MGIVPSNRTTYKLSQFQNALKLQTGAVPYLGCGANGTVLEEVWYFSHVHGTVRLKLSTRNDSDINQFAQEQFGTYKTIDSTTPSSCSETGPIRYLERTPTSEREVRLLP